MKMNRMANVCVKILRVTDASSYPLWVDCVLTDYHGNDHMFHGKLPWFSVQDLISPPCEGEMRCIVVGEKEESVSIDISEPDALESIEGETKFVVKRDQIKDK